MKEFLKPTIGKIIIVLILFIIFEYFFVYPASVMSGITFCKMAPGGSCPEPYFPWVTFIIVSLISLLISYLISCISIWIYSKLKK